LGFGHEPGRRNVYQLIMHETSVEEIRLKTAMEGLDLVPANRDLVGANIELVGCPDRETRLRQALAAVRDEYRFVLLDCPPALDLLTLNALVAADTLLIPIQCEYFALEGVSELLDTMERVRSGFNPALRIEGVLLTMYDDRTNLTRQVAQDLRSFFNRDVFDTVIHRSVRLAEAPSHGKPIILYDPNSRGAETYTNLAKEILSHDEDARVVTAAEGSGAGS